MLDFTGKLVLVTGASRGIGQAILHDFAKHGATVIGTATSDSGANAISENLKALNLKGQGYALDINSTDAVTEFFKQLESDFSAPNIVVNNAGITRDTLFLRMNEDAWQEVINTNLTGMFRVIKACIKPMVKARWGRIINISSVSGIMGNAGQTNYAAAKAGVIGMTKSLAKEFASRNITFNCIAPGFIATDMTDGLDKEAIEKQIPLARMGTPNEISAPSLFLASDGAAYITGSTIHANGGLCMT